MFGLDDEQQHELFEFDLNDEQMNAEEKFYFIQAVNTRKKKFNGLKMEAQIKFHFIQAVNTRKKKYDGLKMEEDKKKRLFLSDIISNIVAHRFT